MPGASVRGAFGGIWQVGLGLRAHFSHSNMCWAVIFKAYVWQSNMEDSLVQKIIVSADFGEKKRVIIFSNHKEKKK